MTAAKFLLVVAIVAAMATVFWLIRSRKISTLGLRILAGVTGLGLAIMIVTDWPTQVGSKFWGSHSVLVESLTGILLAGTVYLAFEAGEQRKQDEIGASIAATAFGGVVDHLIDVDLALAYLASDSAPPVAGWSEPSRPLRWMRSDLCHDDRQAATGLRTRPAAIDLCVPMGEVVEGRARALIDQSVRRLMAAMRDWAPLFTAGREGRAVLVRLGHLRAALLRFESAIGTESASEQWQFLRNECVTLAMGLELAAGSPSVRPEVTVRLPIAQPPELLEYFAAGATQRDEVLLSRLRRMVGERRPHAEAGSQ